VAAPPGAGGVGRTNAVRVDGMDDALRRALGSGEMDVREDLCTRPDILHGGVIMSFADTLGAAATVLNLQTGAGTTTLESKTNFIASAPLGAKILGECTPIHRGRRTQVWQTRITLEDGRLVALVTQTQMALVNQK